MLNKRISSRKRKRYYNKVETRGKKEKQIKKCLAGKTNKHQEKIKS